MYASGKLFKTFKCLSQHFAHREVSFSNVLYNSLNFIFYNSP
jgi:hypothetical protein